MPLDYPDIFSATLGLSESWQVTDVQFTAEEKRLDITLAYTAEGAVYCPLCGMPNSISHSADETWYHSDFFCHATYLHTRVPFFQCCSLQSVERPWSRAGSKFSQESLC